MNRRDAIRFGTVAAAAAIPLSIIVPAEASQIQPKTQNVHLLMTLSTYGRICDLLDEPYYLDDESPIRYNGERFDDTYMIEWFEWSSLHDKLKWEKRLEIV